MSCVTATLKNSLGGTERRRHGAVEFFNVAVTQDMILGATRIETLREVLAGRAHASTMAGLASVPQFQPAARNPGNLSGLGYFDFQKVDWQAARDRWMQDVKKSAMAKTVSTSKEAVPSAAPDWLGQMNLQVVSRHLHYSSSVSWKDAKGIHWDQWGRIAGR